MHSGQLLQQKRCLISMKPMRTFQSTPRIVCRDQIRARRSIVDVTYAPCQPEHQHRGPNRVETAARVFKASFSLLDPELALKGLTPGAFFRQAALAPNSMVTEARRLPMVCLTEASLAHNHYGFR